MEEDILDLQVVGLHGEGFRLQVPDWLTGAELRSRIAQQLQGPAGFRVSVQTGSQLLRPEQSLREQGLSGFECVSYVYEPSHLLDAWKLLDGFPVEDEDKALEGIVCVQGIWNVEQLRRMPKSLKDLTFSHKFDQSLEGIAWPSDLQNLRFGLRFNQTLRQVTWPSSLQHLRFEGKFNQPLQGVSWPRTGISLRTAPLWFFNLQTARSLR